MENLFNLSDEKLKILLDGYFVWCNKNEEDKKYPGSEKQESEKRNNTLLNKEYLSSLSDKKLVDEILKYINTLEGPLGIKLNKPKVTEEVSKIRRNILYIINSPDDPFKKAAEVISGDHRIKEFSKSFWSALLRTQYPELAPNWNNKTDNFLKKLGVNLTTSKKTVEEKYKLFSETFLYLKNLDNRHDFYTLDHLTHYGTVISEGINLIDELLFREWLNIENTQQTISDYVNIRNEAKKGIWEESYKWDILSKVNKAVFQDEITTENIVYKLKILKKQNPSVGSFVYWSNLENLISIANENPKYTVKLFEELFQENKDLGERVDNFIKEAKKFKENIKLSTPLLGYILAAYNYRKYPLYKDSAFVNLRGLLGKDREWKSFSQGQKYEKFQQLSLIMGEYLKSNNSIKTVIVNEIETPLGIAALDGQDFFYYLDEIDKKNLIYNHLIKFLKQAKSGDLNTRAYPKDFKNYEMKVSFGQGTPARIPWIAFLGRNQEVRKGIYPAYLYYKEKEKLILAYTVSEEGESNCRWTDIDKKKKIEEYFKDNFNQEPERYGESYIFNVYDIRNINNLNKEEIDNDLNKILDQYKNCLKDIEQVTIFSKEEVLKEIFLKEGKFNQICSLLENSKKKQLIFQGPPGTGKTFVAQKIALYLTQSENRIETIQFHPSYSYEDFIEGYRPKDGKFVLEAGIFKVFCERAKEDGDKKYILIIDEINRGNLSKIFGELLYLLEYRDKEAKLTYSQEKFSIPENVYIIGTMNTADRSLAIMDYALRRRFYFVDIKCETERLEEWLKENGCKLIASELRGAIENMNKQIEEEMHSKDFAIGHSYFMREGLDSDRLKEVIDFGVKPLLKEYFFDKEDKVGEITDVMNKFYNKKNSER